MRSKRSGGGRPAPLNYASLSLVMLTPSVLIFGFEKSGTRLLRWMQRVLGIANVIGVWLLLTTVLVVHENWDCYKSQDIHDFAYGRCTVRTARIRRMPDLQVPPKKISLWRRWSEADQVFFGVLFSITAMNLMVLATRLIVIRLDLAILSLPQLDDLPKEHHTDIVKRLLADARALARKIGFYHPKHDVALVHLAHRLRYIIALDPASFVLCLPSVMLNLSGLHVVAQIMLCGTTGGTVAIYLFTSSAAWKWWLMVGLGGTALLVAIVHHALLTVRLLHYIDTNKPRADAAIAVRAAEEHGDHISHIHGIVHEAVAASAA